MSKYQDKVYREVGTKKNKSKIKVIKLNITRPYDYGSFVEMIKIDAEVLMKNDANIDSTTTNINKNRDLDEESSEKIVTTTGENR